jgi:hypothetical protein
MGCCPGCVNHSGQWWVPYVCVTSGGCVTGDGIGALSVLPMVVCGQWSVGAMSVWPGVGAWPVVDRCPICVTSYMLVPWVYEHWWVSAPGMLLVVGTKCKCTVCVTRSKWVHLPGCMTSGAKCPGYVTGHLRNNQWNLLEIWPGPRLAIKEIIKMVWFNFTLYDLFNTGMSIWKTSTEKSCKLLGRIYLLFAYT